MMKPQLNDTELLISSAILMIYIYTMSIALDTQNASNITSK